MGTIWARPTVKRSCWDVPAEVVAKDIPRVWVVVPWVDGSCLLGDQLCRIA
jgi:hypothetical protein